MQPYELSATEASELIAAKKLSCEELARSTLDYIALRDSLVQAWSYVDPRQVLRNARELDKTAPASKLHGLTFGVKDIMDTKDMPTTHNSPIYQNHWPSKDAACVAVVRHSGALIVGKTDTVEFASGGRRAATRNPFNLAHTPGGSSSGSGAAVGDKMVQLTFGTQTAGSLIRPAAYNGVYCIKPTLGLVSSEGVKQVSPSLDTVGWYGRSVADLQLVSGAFRLPGLDDAKPVALKGLKVGLCRTPHWEEITESGSAALFEAARRLEAAGAIVTELDLPAKFDRMTEAQLVLMRGEGGIAFLPNYLGDLPLLNQAHRDMVENSFHVTPEQMVWADDHAAECRREFDALFGRDLDIVLTPASSGEAPEGLDSTGTRVFNSMWTLLHVPCVAIPVGVGPRGLPLGIQLIGPRFADARVMAIAAACAPAIHVEGKLAPVALDAKSRAALA
jgi:Asp-tRNA(Asn)/Glu-tRNA(Gln) amidotransferase A subunit family amidase